MNLFPKYSISLAARLRQQLTTSRLLSHLWPYSISEA